MLFYFLCLLLPPSSTLFPYTTLFRSILIRRESVGRLGKSNAMRLPVAQIHNLQLREAAFTLRSHQMVDRKSTRLNSSHQIISYAVFCLKKKKQNRKVKTYSRQR